MVRSMMVMIFPIERLTNRGLHRFLPTALLLTNLHNFMDSSSSF
jgi:hypothetical protein